MKCEKCKKEGAEIDYTKVLTSNPPQYEVRCEKCGAVYSIPCSEAPIRMFDPATGKTKEYYEKHQDNTVFTKMSNNLTVEGAFTPLAATTTCYTADIATIDKLDEVAADIEEQIKSNVDKFDEALADVEKQIKSKEKKFNKKIKDNTNSMTERLKELEKELSQKEDDIAYNNARIEGIENKLKYYKNLEKLKQLYPKCVKDNKVDFDRIRYQLTIDVLKNIINEHKYMLKERKDWKHGYRLDLIEDFTNHLCAQSDATHYRLIIQLIEDINEYECRNGE